MVDPLGLAVLSVTLVVSVWLVVKTLRIQRTGALFESLVRNAFLPEKRHRYLRLLALEGSSILDATIVWSVVRLGVVPAGIGDWIVAAFLLFAVLCVAALTELGLRPGALTAEEKAAIRRESPQLLMSLAAVPATMASPVDDSPAIVRPPPA